MKTIWKAVIKPNSVKDSIHHCFFTGPRGAKPISVGNQNGEVVVWFECDPSNPPVSSHELWCVGTGFGAVPEHAEFIGTVIDQSYVWHFYRPL